MNKPNIELIKHSTVSALEQMFSELRDKKIRFETLYGTPHISENMVLIYHNGYHKAKKELQDFEGKVWNEYGLAIVKLKELENE